VVSLSSHDAAEDEPDLMARSGGQSCFELDMPRFAFFRVLHLEWGG
jgi:hypothetical protein